MPPPERQGSGQALEPLLEETLEELYEGAPCGYLSTLPDGTIVRVNETFLGWTGHDRGALLAGMRFQELLAPGDRIFHETHYAPLLHMQGTVREIAVEIVRADGSRLPVLLNSVLRRDAGGEPRVVRTTVFDATDRRRYEAELLRARREAEARARAATALEHVADGVLLVDENGRIAVANAAAGAILGLEGDAGGRPVAEAIDGWAELEPHVPVGAAGREPPPRATLPFRRGEREQWLSVVGVDAGAGVVYTFRDVTADRRVETMRDRLVDVVSHELRTPLAGVYGAAQTLVAHDLPEDARAQLLTMIAEQAERLRGIVDAIVVARRLDAGELELADAVVDLTALAQSFADERVTVEAPAPVDARGDEGHLRQALGSLVDNALKYGGGGAVRVQVEEQGRRARVVVADDGPGIPPSERERIFERFHRLDPDLHGGVSGVGLGLPVARALVERMGGRLMLEPAGAGATFVIELPLARAG